MTVRCKYLQGRNQEDGAYHGYPTSANTCLSPLRRRRWWRRRAAIPSHERQENFCLSRSHIDCPYCPSDSDE